jgi:hypothetical protein
MDQRGKCEETIGDHGPALAAGTPLHEGEHTRRPVWIAPFTLLALMLSDRTAGAHLGKLVSSGPSPVASSSDYRFAGMSLNNISVQAGVRLHL